MAENIFTGPSNITSLEQMLSISSYEIPDRFTVIGDHAFEGYYNLESIIIPNSVTKIGNNAFSLCGKLKSIIIPKNVKVIGDNVFSWSGIRSISIYDYIIIGRKIFDGCHKLSKINIITSNSESFESLKNKILSQGIRKDVVFNEIKYAEVDEILLSINRLDDNKLKEEEEERPSKRMRTEKKEYIDTTKIDDISIFERVFSFLQDGKTKKKSKKIILKKKSKKIISKKKSIKKKSKKKSKKKNQKRKVKKEFQKKKSKKLNKIFI
jgi:hypothetical protein